MRYRSKLMLELNISERNVWCIYIASRIVLIPSADIFALRIMGRDEKMFLMTVLRDMKTTVQYRNMKVWNSIRAPNELKYSSA